MNLRNITYQFAFLLMLTACDGMSVSEKLNKVDSLIIYEQYDSACAFLYNIGQITMNEEDQAHYYLLRTKIGILTYHPLPSDSLLDTSIAYYEKVSNNHKLADAYYYKAYRFEMSEDYSTCTVEKMTVD